MAQSAFAARKAAQSREQSDNLKGTSTQVQHTEYLNDSGEQPHQPELKPRKKRRRLDAGITGFLNTSAGDLDQDGLVQNGWPIRLNNEAAILQVQFHASADQSISEVRVRVKDQPILDPVQSDDPASKTLQPDLKSILVWDETYQTLDINLQPGNSVSVVGEYDLWVKKGSIRLLGATIHASSDSFRVQSPTTHSIPSIEALSNPFGPASQEIDIRLSSCSSGLRRLRQCDPRFSRIWHNREYNAASFEVVSRAPLEISLLIILR